MDHLRMAKNPKPTSIKANKIPDQYGKLIRNSVVTKEGQHIWMGSSPSQTQGGEEQARQFSGEFGLLLSVRKS